MKSRSSAYIQAIKDISLTQQVLINTDVDPFRGSYSKLNRGIVGRGINSYFKYDQRPQSHPGDQ